MTGAQVLGQRSHDPLAFSGSVTLYSVSSEALRENPLGDPHVRELPVYLPPDSDPGEKLPTVFVLAGFTGRGQSFLETHPWNEGMLLRFDRAVARGDAPRVRLILPDCFTKLGGSQYLDSEAVGRYGDYVADELVALATEHLGADERRAVVGLSSGGFGALRFGMTRPGVFGAVGSISGDCGFENTFGHEFLTCLRGLIPFDGDPERFLEEFFRAPDLAGDGHAVISVLAMAACYSPNPDSSLGFDLPFDLQTGERKPDVWARWLEFDPLNAVREHTGALKALRLLHIECGLRDEFHLQWGTRQLRNTLNELSIPHSFLEHDGGHRGIHHRYLDVIPRLVAALG